MIRMMRRRICTAMLFLLGSGMASAATPPAPELARLYATLEGMPAIIEGVPDAKNARAAMLVFFDANCLYCHVTWKALQLYERIGLQVRWVPVAYQKESSIGRAAAVMLARDRAGALRENETGYREGSYDGGIAPVANPPAALVAQLESNTKLMERFGAPGTPAIVWKDRSGKVRVKVGVPRLSQIPAITGLPEQKNDDPALAGYR